MRAQTPSFVVSAKLLLPESVQNYLEKVFVLSTVPTMRPWVLVCANLKP